MIKRLYLLLLAIVTIGSLKAQSTEDHNKPRLVVNIVISGMRANDITKYSEHFSEGGFNKLYTNGMHFEDCLYSFQQTTTPVALATLTTGAQPSIHGIVGASWFDYVNNKEIDLIKDNSVTNVEYDYNNHGYSAVNLIVPTLSETLRTSSPKSVTTTIALDPISAIVINGKGGNCFWVDSSSCGWASSTAYFSTLPKWVDSRNESEIDLGYLKSRWSNFIDKKSYLNTKDEKKFTLGTPRSDARHRDKSRTERFREYYYTMAYTPAGNSIVTAFAKSALTNLEMGTDSTTDILNICYDTPRNIIEKYGPNSIEAEDMYYRLDSEIEELINFTNTLVEDKSVVFVITSDHGTSPSNEDNNEDNRFNVLQFEVILNGFLSARYGQENWILGCNNRNIYLNHNVIYAKSLSLTEVQDETASFAMQFRGISHALTATAMRSSYFGSGYAQLMQNSFYPRRSGDVVINLMPGWIDKEEDHLSQSGSIYRYDRHVPLIFYGENIPQGSSKRRVDPIDVAPTLARIIGMEQPAACEGEILKEITE